MKHLLAVLIVSLPAIASAQTGPVRVSGGWFRYLLPDLPAAGYFTLANRSDQPVSLLGASSPACGMLMLHRSVSTNGEDRMLMVRSVVVPPHGTLRFGPGGYHLMCMQPHMAVGQTARVSLALSGGATTGADFAVRGAVPAR